MLKFALISSLTVVLYGLKAAAVIPSARNEQSVIKTLYWGQNSGASGQERLRWYCDNTDADMIFLSFLTNVENWELNFSNRPAVAMFPGTSLYSYPELEKDIPYCQLKNVKILLALGGVTMARGPSKENAVATAETLYRMFGSNIDYSGYRPFGRAIVDGVNFDIENGRSDGWAEVAAHLRVLNKDFILAAAPQCVLPDASLGEMMEKVNLDYIAVQFYNNYCGLDRSPNFSEWARWVNSRRESPAPRLLIGAPASPSAASYGYVEPEELAKQLMQFRKMSSSVAGIALWDAAQDQTKLYGKKFTAAMAGLM